MAQQFTPGPWETDEERGLHVVADANGGLVAMLFEAPMIGGAGKPFRDAVGNAALIAAAPDLYAALTNLVGLARAAGVSPTYCNDADDALAKANAEQVSA